MLHGSFSEKSQNTISGFKFITVIIGYTNKDTIFVYIKTTDYLHRILYFETKSM